MFCRACRLVTIKAVGPMRQWLVKQGSFIPIVNVIWWVPGKGRDKNVFLPGFQLIMGGSWLLATTDCLVHNAISLDPPVYEWTITLPVWTAKLLSNTEINKKVIIHVRDVRDIEYEYNVLNVMHVRDVRDVHYKCNMLTAMHVRDVGDSVKYLQCSLLNKQWLIDGGEHAA